MEMSLLEAFCTVAKVGTITRAAEILQISQSAISQMISKLEKDLGTPLLIRLPRGIDLTESGSAFAEYALDAIKRETEFRQRIAYNDFEPSGIIRIGVFSMSSTVVNAFQEFQSRYPKTQMYLYQHRKDLDSLILKPDYFVTTLMFYGSDYEIDVLHREELVLAMPSDHPYADHEFVRLKDFGRYPFISYADSELQDIAKSSFVSSGFTPLYRVDTLDMREIFDYVANHVALALVPNSWRLYNTSDKVLFKTIESPRCERTIRVAYIKDRHLSKQAKLFKDYLTSNFYKFLHISGV